MNPQTMKIGGFIVMVLVAGGILSYQISGGGGGSGGGDSGTVKERKGITFEKVDFDLAELVKSIQEVEFRYSEVRETRNPMTPLIGTASGTSLEGREGFEEGPEGGEGGLANPIYEANRKEVKGILWSPDRPLAVVTDRKSIDLVVGVGYEFEEGIRVKEITHNSIILAVVLEGVELEIVRELLSAEER